MTTKNLYLYLLTFGLAAAATTANAAAMEDEMDIPKPDIQSAAPQQETASAVDSRLKVQGPDQRRSVTEPGTTRLQSDSRIQPALRIERSQPRRGF